MGEQLKKYTPELRSVVSSFLTVSSGPKVSTFRKKRGIIASCQSKRRALIAMVYRRRLSSVDRPRAHHVVILRALEWYRLVHIYHVHGHNVMVNTKKPFDHVFTVTGFSDATGSISKENRENRVTAARTKT